MSTFLYANNAEASLFYSILSTDTSITISTALGSIFPVISGDEYFYITVNDITGAGDKEIMLVTATNVDIFTVIRGQQGTVAQDWDAGSLVSQFVTKSDLDNFIQSGQIQNGYYFYGAGSGSANAITATINSNLFSVPDGFSFCVKSAMANTSDTYLTLTLGSSLIPSKQIVKYNNIPLVAGDIPIANYPIELVYSSSLDVYIMTNPASSVPSSNVSGGASNEILYQSAPNSTGYITAPVVAGYALIWDGSGFAWGVPGLIGSYYQSAYPNPPAGGWLLCDGSAISRVTYSNLFSVIGVSFGVGDGVNTFNLPPLGRFLMGYSGSFAANTMIGSNNSLNVSHTHTAVVSDPGHNHVERYSGAGGGGYISGNAGAGNVASGNSTSLASTGISVSINSAGSSGINANIPESIVCYTFIKY